MKLTVSLKKNYMFRVVYSKGRSIANHLLVMYILPNKSQFNRLGISVSKKVGNSVVRSRVTRLIRESYRLSELSLKVGYDIVIIARTCADRAAYHAIDKALRQLIKKHGLVAN